MDGEVPQILPMTVDDSGALISPPVDIPMPVVRISLFIRVLAGIESGVLGASLMVAWMFGHAWWAGDRYWYPANIWATTMFGGAVMRYGPARPLAGMALQFLMASFVGVAFALVAGGWKRFYWAFFVGLAAGAAWYFGYLSWNRWIAVYSPQPQTFLSYLLFGIVLSRTPLRCKHLAGVLASRD